jgi:hypothetical protein
MTVLSSDDVSHFHFLLYNDFIIIASAAANAVPAWHFDDSEIGCLAEVMDGLL